MKHLIQLDNWTWPHNSKVAWDLDVIKSIQDEIYKVLLIVLTKFLAAIHQPNNLTLFYSSNTASEVDIISLYKVELKKPLDNTFSVNNLTQRAFRFQILREERELTGSGILAWVGINAPNSNNLQIILTS